jgi:hypothetical protein
MKKFPVNIYFQIRFQEIVTKLEQVLVVLSMQNNENRDDGQDFYLKTTQTLYELLCYCWNADCCLSCLLSFFWKLNLQLISRYERFYKQTLNDLFPATTNEQDMLASVDMKFFIHLTSDVKKLCEKLPNFFDAYVASMMRSCGVKEISPIKGSNAFI